MKNFAVLTTFCTSVLLFCGCTAPKAEKAAEEPAIVLGEFSQTSAAEALTVASNFTAGFEKSLLTADFAPFAAVLPANSKVQFTAESFNKMRTGLISLYGNPQKLEYLTFLDQGKIRDYLWRIKFSKPDKDGKSFSSREILFCVRVYCENGKKPDIAGFFFQRF